MNPLSLRLVNVARFADVEIDIPEGCTALVGSNGAGKSTLLNAIEVALFAGVNPKELDKAPQPGKELAAMLAPDAQSLTLELCFEHSGETYRVRRGFRKATATLDFERFFDSDPEDNWETLTRETVGATQALINQTTGLSRRTFGASSFLKQGDADAFPDATSTERKALLGEILDPRGLWPRLADMAKQDARQAEQGLQADQVKIADRATIAITIPELEALYGTAVIEAATAARGIAGAEEKLEQALAAVQANAAVAEKHRSAGDARDAAARDRDRSAQTLRDAKEQADKLAPARLRLAELEKVAATIPELEHAIEVQRTAVAERQALTERKTAADMRFRQLSAEAERIRQEGDRLAAQHAVLGGRFFDLSHADDGAKTCDRCEQVLGMAARVAAIRSLSEEIDALEARITVQVAASLEAERVAQEALAAADAIVVPTLLDAQPNYQALLANARRAQEHRAALTVSIERYEEADMQIVDLTQVLIAATGQLAQREADLQEASVAMGDRQALEQSVAEARAAVTARRNALDLAKDQRVRAEEQLARAQQAQTELDELRLSTEQRQRDLDGLRLAERAFGRDGIPVLLVESVIPQIETEANRILEQMPTEDDVVFTVELRTQRALKGDATALRETLDVLVSDPDGERAYETYSGGERARLNIALRIALARLLAHRRGAESRLLAIDELEYLDELGQERLVDVIRGVAADFDRVVVVSHSPNVRDAFDSVIEIRKADGVSTVVGTREEVPA